METKEKNPGKTPARNSGSKGVSHGKGTQRNRPARAAGKTKTMRNGKVRQIPKESPEVVYMPPKAFNRNRFLLKLATTVAVVLALVLGVSVFFKVDGEKVTVSGLQKYTAWDVFQASGIQDGDNLLTFSRARAAGEIRRLLPFVDKVRIGIKLPDTVMIYVEEVDVTYGFQGNDGAWWLVSASGKIIQKAQSETFTKVSGVKLDNPVAGGQAVAYEPPQETNPDGTQIPVTVTGAQRLSTVLDIADYLEQNGIIGGVDSLDISRLGDIRLTYADRFQVKLGDHTQLQYKISCLKSIIDNMESYASGTVDITDPSNILYDDQG